jgi:hypothetical protein
VKGMGRYALVEHELSNLSSDEINELYLSGDLDKIYEDFDRTGEVKVRKVRGKSKREKKTRGEK